MPTRRHKPVPVAAGASIAADPSQAAVRRWRRPEGWRGSGSSRAHWAEEPSLRWLAYLAPRLDGLAAGMLVALRHGDPAVMGSLLRRLDLDTMRVVRSIQDREADPLRAVPSLGTGPPGKQWRSLLALAQCGPWEIP
jgi:hypothetical protein